MGLTLINIIDYIKVKLCMGTKQKDMVDQMVGATKDEIKKFNREGSGFNRCKRIFNKEGFLHDKLLDDQHIRDLLKTLSTNNDKGLDKFFDALQLYKVDPKKNAAILASTIKQLGDQGFQQGFIGTVDKKYQKERSQILQNQTNVQDMDNVVFENLLDLSQKVPEYIRKNKLIQCYMIFSILINKMLLILINNRTHLLVISMLISIIRYFESLNEEDKKLLSFLHHMNQSNVKMDNLKTFDNICTTASIQK